MKANTIRIDRLLSNMGYCSRRSALAFVRRNRVVVNGGEVLTSHAVHVPEDGAGITINGEPIIDTTPLHILLHKPTGYVCTREKGEHKTVYDLLPPDYYKRRPLLNICGRLDRWVTGLVFLTQDGKLQHQVVSPNRRVKKRLGKTYIVQTWRGLQGNEAEIFKSGTLLLNGEKKPCKPAELEVLDPANNIAKLTLYEGKYHQIRRMFSAIGNGVPRSIRRVSVGPLQLGDLPVGQWRHLSADELAELRKMVDIGHPDFEDTPQKRKARKRAIPEVHEAKQEREVANEEESGEESTDYEEADDDEGHTMGDEDLTRHWEQNWKQEGLSTSSSFQQDYPFAKSVYPDGDKEYEIK